ncbi:MAG TPA: VWA domain-containing protein [Pyrinomonadaceae bacterium]|nr:VWA domain-containing protein [Pyrinomonadaceae bacterium]
MNLGHNFLRIAAFSVFALLCTEAGAQSTTSTPPPHDEDEVIKVDSRLVVVPVSVVDSSGQPVVGLKAENFRIREENRQQTIDSLGNAENVPLEIALLFDVSASTDAMFRFQQETASKFLREVLQGDDRATIFTIGEKGVLVRERETAEAAIAAVRSIVPTKEQTAFYDAVHIAASYLERNTPAGRRKVILIISDGEDTNSSGVLKAIWDAERKVADNIAGARLRELRVKARDTAKAVEQMRVLKALQDADAVVYAINPGGASIELNRMAVFGQENMQKFADDTGGTAFLPKFQPVESANVMQNSINIKRNEEMLERIFRQVAAELRAQYLVQYYSNSEFPVNKFVKLDVGLTTSSGHRVRARQGYFVKN